MNRGKAFWGVLASAAVLLMIGMGASVSPASAEDTVWLCKPGDSEDLCNKGTIKGNVNPPPGIAPTPLTYARPTDAPVDCFYLYPTQSEQDTPNSNLVKDPPMRRVAVQQARMFSTVCDVYAPMYRQVTYSGSQVSYNEEVEIAYQSALSGFKDYLQNYNNGRGFILLGHSQGSAHTARIIDEEIDGNPELRNRLVGAFAPGANIHVPIGQKVGGMYDNVPACSNLGEIGCLVAYSTYKGYPGNSAQFSRLDTGYWIYNLPRPNAEQFEAVCVNPADLDGSGGTLDPLVNYDYLLDVPSEESDAPWEAQPDYYAAECARQTGAHWLNMRTVDLPGESRADITSLVASGNNYHVPEVNLAEGNLVRIAKSQTDAYVTRQKVAEAQARKLVVTGQLNKAKASLKASTTKVKSLSKKLRKAKKKCVAAKRKKSKVKAACKSQKSLTRKSSQAKRRSKTLTKQVKSLGAELKELNAIIG